MHITPTPTMTIARVRELTREMSQSPSPVVCSFTTEQMIDLVTEIDQRLARTAAPAPAPVIAPAPPPPPATESAAIKEWAYHKRTCDTCGRGVARCEVGQGLYAAACASLMDQTRIVL